MEFYIISKHLPIGYSLITKEEKVTLQRINPTGTIVMGSTANTTSDGQIDITRHRMGCDGKNTHSLL